MMTLMKINVSETMGDIPYLRFTSGKRKKIPKQIQSGNIPNILAPA